MTHEQKVSYYTITLNICKYGFTVEQIDLVVRLYDLVCKEEGETNLISILAVKQEHEKAFKQSPEQQTLKE